MTDWKEQARRIARDRLAAKPARIATLWAEAEAEAWQEVRAALKAAMVEALLEEISGQSSVVSGQSSVVSRQSSVVSCQSSAIGGQSSAIGGQSSAVGGQRSVVSDQPSAAGSLPAADDGQSSIVGGQRSAVGGPPCANAIYVYAIIDRTEVDDLPQTGVTEGCPVTLQACKDLAAVVSAVPLSEFGEEALHANLNSLEWLEARVRAHQAVLDALLPQATVLPMKFSTIYLEPSRVEALLAARHDELAALLTQLRGRQEWGLKLYCDTCQLSAHIAEVSPEVAQLKADIASKPKGAAYLLARKLQEAETEEVERTTLGVADQTHTSLAELSVATRMNPLQDCQVTGRAETMLLNAAYLIDTPCLEAFRSTLEALSAEFGNLGFQFELSGPWPAYNFVSLSDEPASENDE